MTRAMTIDALTASVAWGDLNSCGNDLATLAQSLHEEIDRHGVDPATGTRYLMSTMGNRMASPPTGLTYLNVQLLAPHRVPAERRPMDKRFLRGRPMLCGDLAMSAEGVRLETAVLRISLKAHATLDHARGIATFYIQETPPPDTTMIAATGRRLDEVVDVGHCGELRVRIMRTADEREMKSVLGQLWTDGIAVETDLPGWKTIAYEPIETDPLAFWTEDAT